MLISDDGTSAATGPGDIQLPSLDFFGSPATFLLVSGFTGSSGDDLDTDNDGVFESTPWNGVFDAVSLTDGDTTLDVSYAPQFGGPTVANQAGGNFTAAAVSAIPDGSDNYVNSVPNPSDPFLDFSGDTPGYTNQGPVTIVEGGTTDGYTGVVEGSVTDTIDFQLSTAPLSDVTVNLALSNGEVTLSQSFFTFTPGNWFTPQSVTVTADNDTDVEGSHSSGIQVTVSSTDTFFDGAEIPDIPVAIGDNDTTSPPAGTVINELRISHSSLDNDSNNFVEIFTGVSVTDLTGLSLVVISEVFEPGNVDFVLPLDGGSTDADGFHLLHDDGFDVPRYGVDVGDTQANFDFFGSAATFFLVEGFYGFQGLDLDPTDFGLLTSMPWTNIVDSVTFDNVDGEAIGYGGTIIFSDDENSPSGLARRVDGGSGAPNAGFSILEFNEDGQDTPGFTNVLPAGVRFIGETGLLVSENGVDDSFEVVLDAAPSIQVTISVGAAGRRAVH